MERNNLSDLTPLASGHLNRLAHLYLADNEIRDPSPLAKLPRFTTATLYNNCISDLSASEEMYVTINAKIREYISMK